MIFHCYVSSPEGNQNWEGKRPEWWEWRYEPGKGDFGQELATLHSWGAQMEPGRFHFSWAVVGEDRISSAWRPWSRGKPLWKSTRVGTCWNLLEPVGTCWNYRADVMGLLSFLQSNLESLEISRSGIQGVCTFLADEKTEQICRNLLTDCPLKIDVPHSFAMATWMCISVSKCECYVTL